MPDMSAALSLPLLAALVSGLLHAIWNAIATRSSDPAGALMAQMFVAGLLSASICVFVGVPALSYWPWMLLCALANALAMLLLGAGYRRGDYALIYGISRVSVPWALLPLSAVFTGSLPNTQQLWAVLVVALGVALAALTGGRAADRKSIGGAGFALVSGLCVAVAIWCDSRGANSAGALVYGSAQSVLNAIAGALAYRIQSRRSFRGTLKNNLRVGIVCAVISTLSYLLILWVFTRLPVVVGAVLRDSSILFALLIGVLLFGERLRIPQWAGCLLFVAGAVLLRMA